MLALCAQILIWVSKKAPMHLIWPFFSKYQILMIRELFMKISSPYLKSEQRAAAFKSVASGWTPHMPMFRHNEIFTFQRLGSALRSISWPLKLLMANLLQFIPNLHTKYQQKNASRFLKTHLSSFLTLPSEQQLSYASILVFT